MKDDKLYLIHISESIQRIEEYIQSGRDFFYDQFDGSGRGPPEFRNFGESVKSLSADVKRKNPDVPWKRVAGFRDVLIHDYMGVDLTEVWNIDEKNLPVLKKQIEKILSDR